MKRFLEKEDSDCEVEPSAKRTATPAVNLDTLADAAAPSVTLSPSYSRPAKLRLHASAMVLDDEDVEIEGGSSKCLIGHLKADACFKVETPQSHHFMSPGSLSPFAGDGGGVLLLPQKTSSEEDDITPQEYYSRFIARTTEQCDSEGSAPQRSEAWKAARRFALTASDFGAAAGDNPFSSPDDLVAKKVWQNFCGNDATKWGSTCEPKAAEAFLAWVHSHLDPKAKLHEFGLCKWSKASWIAVSPDGVLEWVDADGNTRFDLVEFKCPTRTSTPSHPYAKYPHDTPPYYQSQMLGIWGMWNKFGGKPVPGEPSRKIPSLGRAFFVVWQPKTLWITQHEFTPDEWKALEAKLADWFFVKYLPALVWHYNGELEQGAIAPTSSTLQLGPEEEPADDILS